MSDPVQPLAGSRILVVEDEYLIAMDVKHWLTVAGAIVVGPVPNLGKAFDLIADGDLTAAVLDVNLGDGETVYPVAAVLRDRGVPYLFATGNVKLSDAGDECERPRLTKPYLSGELVRAVTQLLSGAEPGASAESIGTR